MMTDRTRNFDGFQLFLLLVYLAATLVFIYYLARGWDYYLTAFSERPRHAEYRALKPGGDIGHGFGIVGSLMMLLMLLYSLRKRTPVFANWGTLAHWLDIHIYLGIFGPLIIVLHSTLKVNGLVAVSFYSMIAVAFSGILGRYLYLQIPRNIQGHELSLGELQKLDQQFTELLKQQFGFTETMIRQVEHLTAGAHLEIKNTFAFLFTLLVDDFRRKRAFNQFKNDNPVVKKLGKHQVRAMLSLARQKTVLHQRILTLNRVQQLFHYWHVIHKPFAIVMIIIMIVHITIAVMFGYKWIF